MPQIGQKRMFSTKQISLSSQIALKMVLKCRKKAKNTTNHRKTITVIEKTLEKNLNETKRIHIHISHYLPTLHTKPQFRTNERIEVEKTIQFKSTSSRQWKNKKWKNKRHQTPIKCVRKK